MQAVSDFFTWLFSDKVGVLCLIAGGIVICLLIAILNETLDPIRKRRHYYEARIGEVYDILRRGSETARAAAAETLADVRHAMKIDYFDDGELIAAQARQYTVGSER